MSRPLLRRLIAIALIGLGSGASAETPGLQTVARRAVEIVEAVCVGPATPGDIVATGDQRAAASNWVRDDQRSGRHHGPGQKPGDLPFFIDRIWRLDESLLKGQLTIRIVGPDYPGQRLTACSLAVPAAAFDDFVAATRSALELGPGQIQSGGDRTLSTWLLSGDTKKPDAGFRILTVAARKWPAGWVTNVGLAEVKSLDGMLLGEKF